MLFVKPCTDSNLLDTLSEGIFGNKNGFSGSLVLYENDTPIGLANFSLKEGFIIERVGVLPESRGKGAGDFFTRTIIYKSLGYGMPIKVNYISPYFEKLGFKEENNFMRAEAENVCFPSGCCGGK